MTTKPKVLIAADTYYPKVDGTLRFMEEFINRSKQDFTISLLVPKLSEKKKQIRKESHSTTFIEPSKIFKLSGYPNMKISFKNLRKIKQRKFLS